MNLIKFSDGIIDDGVFAHRGDVFVTSGLFKSPYDNKNKDDKILTKENRPVLIISNDETNKNIVQVLPFSSHIGNYEKDSITNGRLIEIPRLYDKKSDADKSYIDISQIFTINVYQLVRKLCRLKQEIVDTAVALNTLHNIQNKKGADLVCSYLNQKFSNPQKSVHASTIMTDPSEEQFVMVEQITTPEKIKHSYPASTTVEECEKLYNDWIALSTDGFRYKYKLNKTQYDYLRNKCIKILIKNKRGFTRFDWKG